MSCTQEWFSIPGFEGKYQINLAGQVRSLGRTVRVGPRNHRIVYERILPFRLGRGGYPVVILSTGPKSKSKYIHKIIAELFIPNPTNLPFVNHKDENKLNFNVENLEWCDHRYNLNYSFSRHPEYKNTWQKSGSRKLTPEQVIEIRKTGKSTLQRVMAEKYGVSRQVIGDVLRGKTFKTLNEEYLTIQSPQELT